MAELVEAEPPEDDLDRDLRRLLQRLGWQDGLRRPSDFAVEHWPGCDPVAATSWAAKQLRRFG